MRAAVHFAYGDPGLVTVAEIPLPTCPVGGYLVRVKACSANPADWKYIHGNWRLLTGNRFPRQIGTDFAGIIETADPKATLFKRGDAVIGSVNPFRTGTAAGIPIAGGTAYMGLCGSRLDLGGAKVLITGSGGGVGHLAVQLARHLGARVTAVCSAEKREFSLELGADEVIDYRDSDVRQLGCRFDLILDCAASLDYRSARPLLTSGGEYILLEQKGKIWFFAAAALSGLFFRRRMRTYVASPSAERCRRVGDLFDSGVLAITVSECFPLGEVGKALALLKDGHVKGKIVIDCR